MSDSLQPMVCSPTDSLLAWLKINGIGKLYLISTVMDNLIRTILYLEQVISLSNEKQTTILVNRYTTIQEWKLSFKQQTHKQSYPKTDTFNTALTFNSNTKRYIVKSLPLPHPLLPKEILRVCVKGFTYNKHNPLRSIKAELHSLTEYNLQRPQQVWIGNS